METEKRSELQILDLNTHCLERIFTYLKYNDLLQLSAAHPHFNDAIGAALTTIPVELSEQQLRKWSEDKRANYLQLIEMFGHKIKHLHLVCIDYYEEYKLDNKNSLDIVKTHITGAETLKLRIPSLNELCVGDNWDIFKSLKSLELECIGIDTVLFKKLLETATELRELICPHGMGENDLDLLTFIMSLNLIQKLDINCYLPIRNREISNSLPINTSVVDLTLTHINEDNFRIITRFQSVKQLSLMYSMLNSNILTTVRKYLPNLEMLSLNGNWVGYDKDIDFNLFLSMLHEFQHLERLNLSIRNIFKVNEDLFKNLSEMKRLTALDLYFVNYKLLQPNLCGLAFNLEHLSNFTLYFNFSEEISNFEFESVVIGFVSVARNLKALKLHVIRYLYADELYQKLVRIRECQKSSHVLNVNIISVRSEYRTILTSKWLKMTIN